MENQYYYKLMASYLSKRNCDESLMRYLFGKNSVKKSPEELERADERKRRLQRERSRRYRALKNARRQHEHEGPGKELEARARASEPLDVDGEEEAASDGDEPPTLCHLESDGGSAGGGSDDNSAYSGGGGGGAAGDLRPLSLKEFLSAPNTELDYPTVHSLMFHWLQT